jgi:hypothetical protein
LLDSHTSGGSHAAGNDQQVWTMNARWEKWVWMLLLVTMLYICAQTIGMAIRTPKETVTQIGRVDNAQNYADWCGGYVQLIGGDISVEGCDR